MGLNVLIQKSNINHFKQVTSNKFFLNEVYNNYELDELALKRIMLYIVQRHNKIDNILRVRQLELYGCLPEYEDAQGDDTLEPLADCLPVVELTKAQNSQREYNVIVARKDHLPKLNIEKAEQAKNNGFFASESKDDLNVYRDDKGDAIIEDY